MRDPAWFGVVAGIAALSVVAAGGRALLFSSSIPGPATPTGTSSVPVVYRNLMIAFNPATGSYDYNAQQPSVPLHVRVIFTITNYALSVAVVPTASDARVSGTSDGGMTVAARGTISTVSALPVSELSHTLSASNGYYLLNVPVPAAASGASPPSGDVLDRLRHREHVRLGLRRPPRAVRSEDGDVGVPHRFLSARLRRGEAGPVGA
jgi:hypothetical protein